MNAVLRTALVRSAFVASGAVAGVGGTYAVTSGAHEEIVMAVGDSLTPRFFIKTDTVLKVVGTKIVAAKCGNGAIYLRTYLGTMQLTADSITVKVCGQATPPSIKTVFVCFSPVDSLQKYDLVKYDSLGRPLSLDARGDSMTRSWGCKDTIYVDSTAKKIPLTQKVGDAKGIRQYGPRAPT